MKTLEVSSIGDKRFSALYAKVSVCGKVNSIENHYQTSKVFLDENNNEIQFDSFKEVKKAQRNKKYTLIGFKLKGKFYKKENLTLWYKSLWYKYFLNNKNLIVVLNSYDHFTDKFTASNTVNSQANVCKQIRYKGINSLYQDIKGFLETLKTKSSKKYDYIKAIIDGLDKGYYPAEIGFFRKEYPILVDLKNNITYVYEDALNPIVISNSEINKQSYFWDWMTGEWNSYTYEDFIESIKTFKKNAGNNYHKNVEFIKKCLKNNDLYTLSKFIDIAMNDNLSGTIE